MNYLNALLKEANARGHRLLCGFDFTFGYPAGTAQMMTNGNNWAAVWELFAEKFQDDIDNQRNRNDRFRVAAELNHHIRAVAAPDQAPQARGEGPFWGRPPNTVIPGLETRAPGNDRGQNLPPERRYCEEVVPGASTVWQLRTAGSVGSRALMGIARLEALRQQRNDVQAWPFETLGEGGNHVLAEIYPSLILPTPGNEVEDRRQVHAVAVRLRDLDEEGLLQQRLAAPGNMQANVQAAMLNEEALFLDITLAGNVYADYLG